MMTISEGSPAVTGTSKGGRLPSFDLLRGLAILAVIAVHASEAFPTQTAILDIALGFGVFGVQLFYFVSAFTMCHMWRLRAGESHPIFNFYVRRFFRIAPLFWIAIPISLLIYGTGESYWAPDGIGPLQIILTFTFLHGFWPDSINSVISGGWSIAVEMTFYIVFPALMLLNKNKWRNRSYLYLAGSLYFAYALMVCEGLRSVLSAYYVTSSATIVQDFLYLNFLSQAPIFILGCFLFFSLKRSSDLYKNVPALCVCLIASFMLRKHFALGEKQFFFLLVIYGVGLLAYAVVRMRLSFGPLERLGRNSYAIYLVHSFVIFGLSTLAGKLAIDKSGLYMFLLAFFTSLAISYWLAVFLHIVVERRAHELSESLVAWRESGVWQLKAIRTKS